MGIELINVDRIHSNPGNPQKNLDAWAEKNGLQLVEEGDSECKSA